MALKLHTRHFEASTNLTGLIERQAAKIRKFLPTYKATDIDLHATVERLPRGNQYQTVLVLTLPQTVIRVEELQDNDTRSAQGAFQELLRRVKRFKSRLNRERLWRRPEPVEAEAPAEVALPVDETALTHRLEKVENYVRRELYHQVLVGVIPAGIIDPHALVDEIFLEVRELGTAESNEEQWIFSLARDRVHKRVSELDAQREEPHIEESVPLTEDDLEEEENFFQPDESLHLEDLIQDHHSANPEELLAREEAAEQLQKAVAHLPQDLRESFVLFALEGFTSDEVAMITSKEPARVLQEVEEARAQIRQDIKQ